MDNGELRLVKLARKGDREAFTQLVVANERMLSRVNLSLMASTAGSGAGWRMVFGLWR